MASLETAKQFVVSNAKGLLVAVLIAISAQFLAEHYGGPAMLFALLIGMSLNFLAHEPATRDGIGFSSRVLLRIGVALLGLRIAFTDIAHLGMTTVATVIALIALTMLGGMAMARASGRSWHYGALTGGAVAICGASAALAIAAILPRSKINEQDTLVTVVGVTILSTLAMIFYPVLSGFLGLSDTQSGIMIGATIHDVAQVVGAGYSISDQAGEVATVVKLLRVAMLPIVLLVLTFALRDNEQGAAIGLPWFLVAFIALMLLVNSVAIPAHVTDFLNALSRWLLVIAVSALGVRTSLGELRTVGSANIVIILGETLVLLALALAYILMFRP
jgi:uncharacterized integral membrane protein (TIGR00698 family)